MGERAGAVRGCNGCDAGDDGGDECAPGDSETNGCPHYERKHGEGEHIKLDRQPEVVEENEECGECEGCDETEEFGEARGGERGITVAKRQEQRGDKQDAHRVTEPVDEPGG